MLYAVIVKVINYVIVKEQPFGKYKVGGFPGGSLV